MKENKKDWASIIFTIIWSITIFISLLISEEKGAVSEGEFIIALILWLDVTIRLIDRHK